MSDEKMMGLVSLSILSIYESGRFDNKAIQMCIKRRIYGQLSSKYVRLIINISIFISR